MLDVTIYEINGKRHYYDHVIAIQDETVNSISIILKTDFDYTYKRMFNKADVGAMKVTVMK